MGTKGDFANALRVELQKYAWASDAARLEKFMVEAMATIDCSETVDMGAAWGAAWKAIGMKGKISYIRLHKLPVKED